MKEHLGRDVSIDLVAGSGGVFEVRAGNRLIFSKKRLNRFPLGGEILALFKG